MLFNCIGSRNAVKIGVGKVNAVSGEEWKHSLLSQSPQNYVPLPRQPWLDGINCGDGYVRQFVAMPLGQGYTVEAQVTDHEDVGGIQFEVYNKFNDTVHISAERECKKMEDYSNDGYIDSSPLKCGLEMGDNVFFFSHQIPMRTECTVDNAMTANGMHSCLLLMY